jgi:hypothetical protein
MSGWLWDLLVNLEIGDVSLVMFKEAGLKIGQWALYREQSFFNTCFIFTCEVVNLFGMWGFFSPQKRGRS